MYFWNSYPFVRFSIALIAGICLHETQPLLWQSAEVVLAFLLGSFAIVLLIAHKTSFYRLRMVIGSLALFSVAFIGGYLTKFHYHSLPPTHYTHHQGFIRGFSGKVMGLPSEGPNHTRYEFELRTTLTDSPVASSGKIHLYIAKDTIHHPTFKDGDLLLVKGAYLPLSQPKNPGQFNYKKYLSRSQIFAQSFVDSVDVQRIGHQPSSRLLTLAYRIRIAAIDLLDSYLPEKRENAISKALLLGVKDFLDNDLKKAYASAGAMHVLAVSGLHVGIIYLILQFLLGKLADKGRSGKIIFGVLTITIIWLYALITGLSPSVLRAATMFSIVALSQVIARDSNIYNSLGIAAFALLLFDPYLVFSVGFQLSFAAVFGIAYLQPKLYALVEPRYWVLDKIWALTCVSLSAQVATFPFSAYYFHQFPTYFLLSNLIAIPGAFLILIVGIALLTLAPIFPIAGSLLGRVLYLLTWAVNEMIEWIESLPHSLIDWIHIEQTGVLLIYAFMVTVLCGMHYKAYPTLALSIVALISFLTLHVHAHAVQANKEELVFYSVRNQTAIDYIKGHQASLFTQGSPENLAPLITNIAPYRRSSYLPPVEGTIINLNGLFRSDPSLIQGVIAGRKILIIDSTTFHLDFKQPITSDILIINNESVWNLKWLQQHFRYQYLLIGNQNSWNYSRRIKRQAREQGVVIHSLVEDGAFLLSLKHKKRADKLPALFTTNPD